MADMNEKWRERYRRLQEWQRQGKHTPALHVEESEAHVCLNCGTEFRGHFCPGCGQKGDMQRLTVRSVTDNLLHLFTHADGRLWHTVRDLFSRPGYMMRDYIRGHRVEYISPIQLLFFLATLYLAVKWLFHVDVDEAIVVQAAPTDTAESSAELAFVTHVQDLLRTFLSNKALSALVMSVFLAFPLRFCIRRTEYGRTLNYVELYFFSAYMECQVLIAVTALLPVMGLTGWMPVNYLSFIDLVFFTWNIRQLLEVSWWRSLRIVICTYALFILEMLLVCIIFGAILAIVGIATGSLPME